MANPKTADQEREFVAALEALRRDRERQQYEAMWRVRNDMMQPVPSTWGSMPMPSSSWYAGLLGGAIDESTPPAPTINAIKLDALKAAEPRKAEARVPDYFTTLTGWRGWKVNPFEMRLGALGVSAEWKPRKEMRAKCTKGLGGKHKAPNWDCECGIWAFSSLDNLVAAIGSGYKEVKVIGQVELWGKIIETENGFRAERAYPKELWLLDNDLEELGLIYDVPIRSVTL